MPDNYGLVGKGHELRKNNHLSLMQDQLKKLNLWIVRNLEKLIFFLF